MAVARGRRGGLKGGPARTAALTAAQRSRQASEAAKQRWRNHKLAVFMSLLKTQRLLAGARIARRRLSCRS
jgi:hypothetical protein